MQVQLMRYTGERNRINKSAFITNTFAMNGELKDFCDTLNPVIQVQKTNNPINNDYNYMYIPEYKRYYYISIQNDYDRVWTIKGKVDVLYSHMYDILRNQCIVDKAENINNANLYLNDGSFVMDSRKYNQVYNFPTGLSSNGHNILIVAGGANNA